MTRDDVMAEYTGDGWDEPDVDGMAHEIVRLRAILAKLREPSEKTLCAAIESVSYGASYAVLMHCLPIAVAAAEDEVRQ